MSYFENYRLRKDVEIISTSSGEPISARNLCEVLQYIVRDTLQEPLLWTKVVRKIVSALREQDAILTSAGPVRAADSLLRELTKGGVKILDSTEMQPLRESTAGSQYNDIAIVGFASRLPDCETLEEVWTALEAGRDLHKKVSKNPKSSAQLATDASDRFPVIDLMSTAIAIHPEKPKTPP